jgi:tetratricopeptide (TPR) repeat protein
MNKILKTKLILASTVATVTFMVYLPSLQNGFVWDDTQYVYKNPFIRSLNLHLLKSAFTGFHASNWHPLTWVSHALDYAIWGLNPLGHHLTNNVLHALNTLMVVLLVMRLLEIFRKTAGNKGLLNDRTITMTAVGTGLLFGLHPLHVESVAWVAERKDLLCAFFYLLTIPTYIEYVKEISALDSITSASHFFNRKYLLAIGFFTLSLLSKPMAVSLPLVLLILDWYLFGRIQSLKAFWAAAIEKLPFLALALVSSIVTMSAQQAGGAVISIDRIPLTSRLLVAARSLVAYLVKMILPINLVPFYPYPEDMSLFSPENIVPVVLVIAITATCIAVMRRQKLWISVWSYYVITLIPVLGIVQVGSQSMADRYTYLPSLGVFLIIGLIFARVYEKVSASDQWRGIERVGGLFIVMSMLISLSYVTVRQIGVWKNSIVFWNYVIDKEPGRVSRAHNNLGNAYLSQGLTDMAIEQYRTALKLKPDNVGAHYNLGNAYLAKGLADMAIEQYQTVLRLEPDYAEAHNNLGNAYKSQSQLDRAIEQYRAALRLKPDLAEPHYNLGTIYEEKRELTAASEQYREVLQINPGYVEAHYNLGRVYVQTGRADEGMEELKTAVRLSPEDFSYRNTLGILYGQKGLRDEAIEQFEEAVRLAPENQSFRRNLERAREMKKKE